MTDLTKERLDELEELGTDIPDDGWGPNIRMCTKEEYVSLLAMAKRTEAAESAMEMYACEMSQFADEVKGLERERDALRVVARIIADAGFWDWHTELSHWVLDGMPDDYDDEVIGLSVAEARAALAQPSDAGGES